jgi:WS/DGAT/MGAT family acyltransferase
LDPAGHPAGSVTLTIEVDTKGTSLPYEQLTAADAVFLRIETPHEPQHVGSLSVIEGGPLRDASGRIRFDELQAHVARRIHRVPRLRQRVMEVPYNQARPVWVDDEHFDIAYHVRLTALPRPGDDDQLAALMSRLQSLPLDRARPLWEMWFVDGLADDHVAMILKIHHALGDGIANVDLALALVDLEPDPPPDGHVPEWRPQPAPSPNELLSDALREQLAMPGRIARSMLDTMRDPRPAIDAVTNVGRTVANFLAKPPPAPWNVPVSSHRRWVNASVPLKGVRTVRKRHDVSINDVVLAACSGALRTFLLEHGDEGLERRVIKAMVPVSLRGQDQHGDTLGNLVSLIIVDLPVGEPDPVERLRRIHAMTSELKGSGLVDGAHRILDIADAFTPLAGPLTRYVSRTIPMNLVITNIPGPPIPLYLRGARFVRVFPYVEVIDNEGLTIAVVSYEDELHFGITADRDVMPDLGDVAASIEHEFAALARRR